MDYLLVAFSREFYFGVVQLEMSSWIELISSTRSENTIVIFTITTWIRKVVECARSKSSKTMNKSSLVVAEGHKKTVIFGILKTGRRTKIQVN